MHLLIAFAHCSATACTEALRGLELPHLDQLLARMRAGPRDTGDDYSLSPPHERVLARACGWTAGDGQAPWAAWQLARQGAAPGQSAWAQLTPCHWDVGMDHITMADPLDLQLTADESAVLLAAMQPWFAEDGIALHYDTPLRWFARSPVFEGLACASLDRVIGRNIDAWMPGAPQAAPLRRLQNEMQMLLYNHPVNDERAARGQPSVNSFWVSGAGSLPSTAGSAPLASAPPIQPAALRSAALREDWAAWAQAWRAIDAQECAALLQVIARGEPARLSLCGERSGQDFESAPQSLRSRLSGLFGRKPAARMLETL